MRLQRGANWFDRLAQLKKKIAEQRKHLDELETHM